ncbi:MAG: hypothetical protein ACLTJ5_00885 [Clostridium sp.]
MKRKNKTPVGKIAGIGNGAIPVRDYAGTIHTGESSSYFTKPNHRWKRCNNMGLYLFWKLLAELITNGDGKADQNDQRSQLNGVFFP